VACIVQEIVRFALFGFCELTGGKAQKAQHHNAMNSIRPTPIRLLSLFFAMLCMVFGTSARAASVHLKGDQIFEDVGNHLEATISLAGLGNKDITVMVTVTGTAYVTYFNPGGNEPPGQNKIPVTAVTWVTVPASAIKNGNVTVKLTSPDVDVGDAPNPNWSVQLDDVWFETATITVIQRGKVALNTTVDLDP
jgi:hypothetical protein